MPTEWLKLMLEEIQRRQDEARRAREEEAKRRQERGADADTRRPQSAA